MSAGGDETVTPGWWCSTGTIQLSAFTLNFPVGACRNEKPSRWTPHRNVVSPRPLSSSDTFLDRQFHCGGVDDYVDSGDACR